MKSRKSHYGLVSYHSYSTYIHASNQAIRDQKPIKKVQITPKPRTIKKIEKISQTYVQKEYMTPLPHT